MHQDHLHTIDIKLAAILAVEEIPIRFDQPITCRIEQREGKDFKQFRFWFDVTDPDIKDKALRLINEYYAVKKDIQDSVREAKTTGGKTVNFPDTDLIKMISVQMFKDTFLHWIKTYVEPMKTVEMGDKTVTLSANATKETKDKIRNLIR